MKKALVPVIITAVISSSPAATLVSISSVTGFQQGDTFNGDGSTTRLISGAGLTKPGANDISTWTHSTLWQDGWQGNGFNNTDPDPIGWLVIDLGSSMTNLENLYLWNVNEPGTIPTNRGVQGYRIFTSDTPTVSPPAPGGATVDYSFASGGWSPYGGDRILPKGPGLASYTFGAQIDLTGTTSARYIGFEFISNYGAASPNRIGLAEIVVTAVPEPSALLLSLGGAIALASRRRR